MKDFIKLILGVCFIILAIAGGIYVGVYLCLVQGIVYLINVFVNHQPIITSQLAWNIMKILCSQVFGTLTFLFFWILGQMSLVINGKHVK